MNLITPARLLIQNAVPAPRPRSAIDILRGKQVLVTGACGTVGRQLARHLLDKFEVGALVGLDHNETELAFLDEEHRTRSNARFLLADMRDPAAVLRETRRIDVVFHAAAYKHVNICERSPMEAIQTNVLGVQNIIQAVLDNGVEMLVFTSSDKAVNPTNVMGTSKLMGERLVTASAAEGQQAGATLLSTRFGNVLGSRGSVIPLFCEQIRKGGPVTLTDLDMTRFIMSIEEAIDLVVESVALGQPGDVLITKMPAIRIADLAEVMIQEYAPRFGYRPRDIEIQVIGPKPGEKLYEELITGEETRRALELERYCVVRPATTVHAKTPMPRYQGLVRDKIHEPYNSSNVKPMSQNALHAFLLKSGLVHAERRTPVKHARSRTKTKTKTKVMA